eukprot:Hpha_TRINITY_DN16806_c0_g4::TRINITY_DN16806_c0_g4_i1::g.151862::m.151862/K15865/CDKAL1; threonylcarbamoyladenosine tRNA methylthiotransferase CDKAL1
MADIEDLIDGMPAPGGERVAGGSNTGGVVPRASRVRRGEETGSDRPEGVPCGEKVWLRTYGCSHNTSDSEYMAGLLTDAGYKVTDDFSEADCFLVNSCTVKNPSEEHFLGDIRRSRATGKPTVVAGCVPSGDPKSPNWDGVSVVGVQQIHRVVEVVGEALRGHRVQLTSKGKPAGLPKLALPKVRRNQWIEVIPINAGCLNKCTYCKTKHARGDLQSYPISEICDRVREVLGDGVKEIRLTSEDTGAYGRDIGTDIVKLLREVIKLLPEGVMMRVGMTNPPYIMDHLEDIAEILDHPRVYSFLHCPVQAGSNGVLDVMAREYTVEDFMKVCDVLRARVPHVSIATDIICGFPSETEEAFQETLSLCRHYKFPSLYISQFYPRQGTPAAAMKQLKSEVKKDRSRRLTSLFEEYTATQYQPLVGTTQRVWVTEMARDGTNLVGHTKGFVQVLLPPGSIPMGSSGEVRIVAATRHSVNGELIPEVKTESRNWMLVFVLLVVLAVGIRQVWA